MSTLPDLFAGHLDSLGLNQWAWEPEPSCAAGRRRPRNFLRADILIGALNAWADATNTGLSIMRVPNTEEPWRLQIGHRPFWFGEELEKTLLAAIVEAIVARDTAAKKLHNSAPDQSIKTEEVTRCP